VSFAAKQSLTGRSIPRALGLRAWGDRSSFVTQISGKGKPPFISSRVRQCHRTMPTQSFSNPLGPLSAAMRRRLRSAFARLLDPIELHAKAGREASELAFEVGALRAAGLTKADLRWLLDKNYLQWMVEKTRAAEKQRVFRGRSESSFSDRNRLVLTSAGFRAARLLLAAIPYYDRELRELWARGELVKRFTQPAHDQDTVLSTFEDLGWPRRIDDPLPLKRGRQSAKLRLRDTIKRLNQHQQRPLLRFRGNGIGVGILWEFADEPDV
jgi:hypothetical protein